MFYFSCCHWSGYLWSNSGYCSWNHYDTRQETRKWFLYVRVVRNWCKLFFKNFGHRYPCFGLLVTSALGFKAMVDFSLAYFLSCMLLLRFTYGTTPANLLAASMVAGHIPHMRISEVGCQGSNGGSPAQRADALTTRPPWPAYVWTRLNLPSNVACLSFLLPLIFSQLWLSFLSRHCTSWNII